MSKPVDDCLELCFLCGGFSGCVVFGVVGGGGGLGDGGGLGRCYFEAATSGDAHGLFAETEDLREVEDIAISFEGVVGEGGGRGGGRSWGSWCC